MRIEDFQFLLSEAKELTPSQLQQTVKYLNQDKEPEQVIGSIVESNPSCPHCHHTPCGRWGNAHGLPRYHCSACGKTFNALTGTPLAHLRHRECWV